MPETLEKLRPDRDLQCYFERPSAIAALSQTSASGFTVSGSWRQQFDWAVIEWNRDNIFEHPLLRNLPDGDLSGLHLSYEETRQNCIPLDADIAKTVDWPSLRVWADNGSGEAVYKVPLKAHATAIEGSYAAAGATFELQGTAAGGDYVELAWQSEHFNFAFSSSSIPLSDAAQDIVDQINGHSPTLSAARSGNQIILTHRTPGENGNRLGVYATVYSASGPPSESWQPAAQTLSGGTSPTKWRFDFDFSDLRDEANVQVPTAAVRKMRWTYAAALQPAAFVRSEFEVAVGNWTVTGAGRGYQVAGPESRRVEDDRTEIAYSGSWTTWRGNYSGGSIRFTTTAGDSVSFVYTAPQDHSLYLGTLSSDNCASISIVVDGQTLPAKNLLVAGEVALTRVPLGNLTGGVSHTVTVTHAGPDTARFFFDFFEIAVPVSGLPDIPAEPTLTLATDWDTDHSIALAPERTAWLIHKLGFYGRANHYVGALWFYELVRQGHQYASGTVEFTGTPVFSQVTEVTITLGPDTTHLQHVNLIGDTAESIAKAFELVINDGFTAIWAESSGALLTIHARAMGDEGNAIGLGASPVTGGFLATASGANFTGGNNGDPDFSADFPLKGWRTDLTATPRINRAARDWSRSYFQAMNGYGIEVAAAFSTELQHGDFTVAAGIAQRYPSGSPVLLNTPALQTNFSPTSAAFWRQSYLDLAGLMAAVGQTPFLQFGEVQWWYFPYDLSGLPFYDDYTATTFAATYSRAMHVFVTTAEDPQAYPEEAQFLPGLIGAFTNGIMDFVRQTHPTAKFEVLYPPDVNDFPLTRVINFPLSDWTPSALAVLKTENFTYTYNRDLNKCRDSVLLPMQLGFARSQSSHLVGIGDYTTPWLKEVGIARSQGVESVVLFALDQFCLVGYDAPLERSDRRSSFMGSSMV